MNGNRATTLFEGIIQRFEHQPMDGTDDGGSPSSSRLLESEEVLDVDRIKDDNFYLMAVAHDESRTLVHYDFDRVFGDRLLPMATFLRLDRWTLKKMQSETSRHLPKTKKACWKHGRSME